MADPPASTSSSFTAPLTRQYGALKGWQWAAVLGTMTGVYLYLHARNAAKNAAAPTGASMATDPNAMGSPGPRDILAPIIIQQGGGSTGKTGPAGPPGPPGPGPKKPQPAPAAKFTASQYSKTIAANSTTGKTLTSVGSVSNGKYSGKNTSSGAPVYALVDTGYGKKTSYVQDFQTSKLPNGTKLYTLPQFAGYFK